MTVINSLGQLKHDFEDLKFWKLAVFEPLPIIIKLATRKILHDNNQPLMFSLSHRINEFDYIFVLEVPKGLNFFFNHAICLILVLKIEILHCNLLPSQLVNT